MPYTFKAVFQSIVDATMYSCYMKNRKEIAKAIAPRNFLNQPVEVVDRCSPASSRTAVHHPQRAPPHRLQPLPLALHGRVDPQPDEAWGYVKGDVDYGPTPSRSSRPPSADMSGKRASPPGLAYKKHFIMGMEFRPRGPRRHINS
jgi:nitrate/nitrite transport system substrate-binding protein